MSTIWKTWCYRTSNNYLKENNISTILGHFYYSGNYLIGDFNVNLMNRNKMLLKKQYFESNNQTLPIVKKYIDLFFSHSFHQIFMKPTRIIGHPKTLTENILKNSPKKVVHIGVIEMGLSDHELIYCSRKT